MTRHPTVDRPEDGSMTIFLLAAQAGFKIVEEVEIDPLSSRSALDSSG